MIPPIRTVRTTLGGHFPAPRRRRTVRPPEATRPSDGPLTLTAKEAAARIGLGLSATYALLRCGELRGVQVGTKWLVPVGEPERWLAERVAARRYGEG